MTPTPASVPMTLLPAPMLLLHRGLIPVDRPGDVVIDDVNLKDLEHAVDVEASKYVRYAGTEGLRVNSPKTHVAASNNRWPSNYVGDLSPHLAIQLHKAQIHPLLCYGCEVTDNSRMSILATEAGCDLSNIDQSSSPCATSYVCCPKHPLPSPVMPSAMPCCRRADLAAMRNTFCGDVSIIDATALCPAQWINVLFSVLQLYLIHWPLSPPEHPWIPATTRTSEETDSGWGWGDHNGLSVAPAVCSGKQGGSLHFGEILEADMGQGTSPYDGARDVGIARRGCRRGNHARGGAEGREWDPPIFSGVRSDDDDVIFLGYGNPAVPDDDDVVFMGFGRPAVIDNDVVFVRFGSTSPEATSSVNPEQSMSEPDPAGVSLHPFPSLASIDKSTGSDVEGGLARQPDCIAIAPQATTGDANGVTADTIEGTARSERTKLLREFFACVCGELLTKPYM
ncbi:hypothetical protein GGF50DRAFT_93151 [Schizophyllum commune]